MGETKQPMGGLGEAEEERRGKKKESYVYLLWTDGTAHSS
jgi:hypothetical protein